MDTKVKEKAINELLAQGGEYGKHVMFIGNNGRRYIQDYNLWADDVKRDFTVYSTEVDGETVHVHYQPIRVRDGWSAKLFFSFDECPDQMVQQGEIKNALLVKESDDWQLAEFGKEYAGNSQFIIATICYLDEDTGWYDAENHVRYGVIKPLFDIQKHLADVSHLAHRWTASRKQFTSGSLSNDERRSIKGASYYADVYVSVMYPFN